MLGEIEGNSADLGCSLRQWGLPQIGTPTHLSVWDLVVQTYKMKGVTRRRSLQNWCRKKSNSAWPEFASFLKSLVAPLLPPAPFPLILNISRAVYFTSPLFPFQSQLQIVLSLLLQPFFFLLDWKDKAGFTYTVCPNCSVTWNRKCYLIFLLCCWLTAPAKQEFLAFALYLSQAPARAPRIPAPKHCTSPRCWKNSD